MKYLSIDIETTGTDSQKHQILEFAAILEDTEKRLTFEEIPKFRCLIDWNEITSTPIAIAMNKRIFTILGNNDLREDYETAKDYGNINLESYILNEITNTYYTANLFKDWLNNHCKELLHNSNITVAGKNFSSFDLQFLKNSKHFKDITTMFSRRTIDPAHYFIDFTKDAVPPSLDICLDRAELNNEYPHDALYDAWAVIELLRTQY